MRNNNMLSSGRYNKNKPSQRYQNNNVPHQPGIYRFLNTKNDVIYVGRANDLFRRQGEHINTGKLKDSYTFEFKTVHGNTSQKKLDNTETRIIQRYNPKLNKYKK